MRKHFKLILTASLLLNVLLVGLSATLMYRDWADEPWNSMKEHMSPESRNMMARTFQKTHRDIRPIGQQAREARKQLMEAIKSPDFDGAQFDAAVDEFQKAQQAMMKIKVGAMKEIAQNMPPEERAKIADKLSGMLDRGRHGRKYDHPQRPDGEKHWGHDKTQTEAATEQAAPAE